MFNANIANNIIKPYKMKANKILTQIERFINRGHFARLVLALNGILLIVFAIVKIANL